MVYTGATVEPLGSFVSDLYTKWGDLDVSIKIHAGSHTLNMWRNQKETLLVDPLRALESKGNLLQDHELYAYCEVIVAPCDISKYEVKIINIQILDFPFLGIF